jgi:hypothetical protein
MNNERLATEPGNDENGWQAWPLLLGELTLARMPSATDSKQMVKAYLESGQRLSERLQEGSRQWWTGWHQRADTAGFIDYCRQCGETHQDLAKRLLDWQMQAAAQWQQQGYALPAQLLSARGDGDQLLAFSAAQQAARKQWDEQTAALLQWFGGISPAFLQCLQQWLDFGSETPATPDVS